MSFYTQAEQDYFASFGSNVHFDETGLVNLVLAQGQQIQLSPFALSNLLNVHIQEAREILKKSVKIAIESEAENIEQVSHILMALAEQQEETFDLPQIPDYQKNSLISLSDIAESLQVKQEFASDLFHQYQQPISDEHDLQNFMDFVDNHLQTHYGGDFPEEAKQIYVRKKKQTFDPNFTPERIEKILIQEAPLELRSHEEIIAQRAFERAYQMMCEMLDIHYEEAMLVLKDSENLRNFLQDETDTQAKYILSAIRLDNLTPLQEFLQARIDALFGYMETEDSPENHSETLLDNSPTENAPSLSNEALPNFRPLFEETGIEESDNQNINNLPQSKNIIIEENSTPPLDKQPKIMPNLIEDKLMLCFEEKKRITGKSLATILKMHEQDVSTELAHFIIEEGGYGDVSDKRKILHLDGVQKLIHDIQSFPDLRGFIKHFLKIIHDQVHKGYYG